jgi:NADPH:quinone reductase-like Zn-dependent oxidoreductase
MRAVVVREHGGVEKLEIATLPDPDPGPGEIRVALATAALNHLDLWVRRGIAGVKYPLPLVPGCDGAGVVSALGPGVDGPPPGTRVALQPGLSCGRCAACLGGMDMLCRRYGILGETRNGTEAEFVCVPAANVMPISDALTFEAAAAFPLVFLTAWHMAVERARVQPADTVLVHAGASGVGSAAIQIAKSLQARVFATVGSAAKVDAVRRLGADEVIVYRDADFASEVWRLSAKRGVDVILDHVGADTWEGNLRSLAPGGRLVVCGATSGFEVPTNLRRVYFKNLAILGSTMGSKAALLRVLALVEAGALQPVVDRVLSLEQVAEGHRLLESRAVVGKVVLRIRDGAG